MSRRVFWMLGVGPVILAVLLSENLLLARETPEIDVARREAVAIEVRSHLHHMLHRELERRTGGRSTELRWPRCIPARPDRWIQDRVHETGMRLEVTDTETVRTDFPTPGARTLPLWEVRMEARGRGTLSQLVDFLESLDRGERAFHVPRLLVERAPEVSFGNVDGTLLTFTMQLVAFGSTEGEAPPGS